MKVPTIRFPKYLQGGMDGLPDLGTTSNSGIEEVGTFPGQLTLGPDAIAGDPFVSSKGLVNVLVEGTMVATAAAGG